MEGRALATEASCRETYVFADPPEPTLRVAVLDGGCKRNILRLLEGTGAYVRVHPIDAPAEEFVRDVDAVLVSNGPGDPAALPAVVGELRTALGTKPLLGICLGFQLLALACGATTYKLKFGHRGANQPVRDLRDGSVSITSQNHGFGVDRASLEAAGGEVTHVHLNDGSVSGFVHPEHRVYAVQYHPEAAPGPHDARTVFTSFLDFAHRDGGRG
jgi:carbamoyl-phosphate synthase small subunit